MFIIQLTYKAALKEVDKYLTAHREFLDYHYKQGLLVASGPKNPRSGGVIIALGKNQADIEAIFARDPFVLADIAEYEFIEFTPVKHCDALKEMILKAEGKLC